MTEHLAGDEIARHLGPMDFEVAIGKADKSLTLNQVAYTTVDNERIGETRAQFLSRSWREILKQSPPRPEDSLKALAESQRTQCRSEPKVHDSSTPRRPVHFGVDRQAVQRCDHWSHDEQCVIRRHIKPRRALYDPFQCEGASKLGSLTSTRVTHGEFEDGTKFTRQDNWTCKSVKSIDMGR